MIVQKFEYTVPKSLDEALRLLTSGAKPLAGGMSLIPMMKLRLAAPEHLVDLRALKELNYIREEGGQLHIGATTSHYDIESSALLRQKCPLLTETAAAIGDVQVRNVGTIGGSVAHADPAADYPAALVALEAVIHLRSAKSDRTIEATDFFIDAFTTAMQPGEIIVDVQIGAEKPSEGYRYEKVPHPASGFPVVGVAARIHQVAGKITLARIGVTGMASHAFRGRNAEDVLEAGGSIADAVAVLGEGIEANSDIYASAEYRKHLTRVHAARAITAAISRAS